MELGVQAIKIVLEFLFALIKLKLLGNRGFYAEIRDGCKTRAGCFYDLPDSIYFNRV